jgi:hypothetical protein
MTDLFTKDELKAMQQDSRQETLAIINDLIREIKVAIHSADKNRVISVPLWRSQTWVNRLYCVRQDVRDLVVTIEGYQENDRGNEGVGW